MLLVQQKILELKKIVTILRLYDRMILRWIILTHHMLLSQSYQKTTHVRSRSIYSGMIVANYNQDPIFNNLA